MEVIGVLWKRLEFVKMREKWAKLNFFVIKLCEFYKGM